MIGACGYSPSAIYVVTVAALTGLLPAAKGRDTVSWFIGGFAGGLPCCCLR